MTQHQTPSPATSMSGILGGTGADLIRATIYLRAVPSQPPAGLAEDVHASYDSRGQLVDWSFGPARPDREVAPDSFAAYRAWRSDFASDRLIGEHAFVTSLLAWAAGRCDLSTLHVLRLPSARVDSHTALTMNLQVGKAQQRLEASADTGFGLSSPDGHQAVFRALFPTDPATVLLEDHRARLTVGTDGLRLQDRSLPRPLTGITGWRMADDRAYLSCADGEVELTGSTAALLRVAGRHAPEVRVRVCSLASLAAPLLVALHDACTLAGHTRSEIRFHSSWD